MLDIKWIREHKEEVQRAAERKGIPLSIEDLLASDDRRRSLLQEIEQLRQARNRLTRETNDLMKNGKQEEADESKAKVREVNGKLTVLENGLSEIEAELHTLLLQVPNITSTDTPFGRSDEDNVEIRRVGEPAQLNFEALDHIALGELHQIIDLPRGVKTAGSRNYYLKGAGVQLHRAVQQLAVDLLTSKGFTLLEVPLLVRTAAMMNTGFFPAGEEQTFRIADDDKWLVGTSEVPIVSFYSNEIVDVTHPLKLAAVSQCFRNEVGSAGRDVHGLYRVHQFAKVEQVILCRANLEESEQMLQELTQNAEELLQLLELPYRVMAVCTGDMSQKTYKQYDLESWMPSRQAYGETHSSSNILDFQARRSNIRYRDDQGSLKYCYTLNNTAVASPRILIPLLENHQEEDGAIRIPLALRPYMNGMERLVPNI
ncbi:serine--tRNA ligase [Paenibacillus radicis (ex Xue et al. 2023)]|uniref:Serine--tRNA ligase n=1 Tax=Paenibacillus radicis (ex Xue et al. 2023) TaxID=2972489 RepID=A0ABT1YQN8_9BACL|nr:serine--tRNA ligase [Paenibacillus radicis (ex Xue et al. 2023)]MCR8634290.1 serine--tRNA ligase [Paenibacillus radicis (ex Xue et al. 2023)]